MSTKHEAQAQLFFFPDLRGGGGGGTHSLPGYEAKLVHVRITSLVPRPCARSSLAV